jgi:hypothetical protein
MDNEMIERCAKALWDNYQSHPHTKFGVSNSVLYGEDFRGKAVPWEHITSELVVPSIAQVWRDKAIIVFKAMREPTDSVLGVSVGSIHWSTEEVWQMFIDAIIGDK